MVVFALVLFGCEGPPAPTATKVEGEYIYKYAGGEIEVWTLHQNLSYEEKFFRDFSDYNSKSDPAFRNNGYWSLEKDKVVVSDVLNFYDFAKIGYAVSKPQRMNLISGRWIPPHNNSDAKIEVAEDIEYVWHRTK